MSYAPIVLFVYNRPWHTQQTVQALQKNILAADSELFIFSDAAKTEDQRAAVLDVRHYVKRISGFKNIVIKEQETNLGLANSIISGVTEIIKKYNKVIVLEDDIVTDRYFLQFMNDALIRYEENPFVGSVHGYVYPVKKKITQNFFLKYADCWGWATWKRAWNLFEADGQKLLDALLKSRQIKKFDFDNTMPFLSMLKDQINGKNNSWAIRWQASLFLADKLSFYPKHSLVHNIGNDASGVHCGRSTVYDVTLLHQPIVDISFPVQESAQAYTAIKCFFKNSNSNSFGFSFLIKKYLKILFRIMIEVYKKVSKKKVVPNQIQKTSEYIKDGDNIIALIVKSSFSGHGIHFFTPNDFSQQLGYMHHQAGKIIDPHVHNPVARNVLFTKEVLFIKKGKLRVDFYDDNQIYLESKILEAGDVILLARGGHGFEVLEEVEMFEVKQGPYAGEQDKTRFEHTFPKNIKFNAETNT